MSRYESVCAACAVLLGLVLSCGAAQAADGPPPLPFHTIEGYGGGAITPMAYLVNPSEDPCCYLGKPSVAISYANMHSKSLTAITVTQTVFGRVELGYGADECNLGSLPGAIREATTFDIRCQDAWLHNFNVRFLAMKENEYELLGLGLPAFTVGIHFKYNDHIAGINDALGGALAGIGYRSSNSQDYTFTFTKMFPKVFGRALIASAGVRLSEAAELGFLGFGDEYRPSFEGNLCYMLTDRLLFAYEFRQKHNPYGTIPGLIDGEDHWHTLSAGLILNSHSTLVFGYGNFGTVCNEEANGVWLIQMKYEF